MDQSHEDKLIRMWRRAIEQSQTPPFEVTVSKRRWAKPDSEHPGVQMLLDLSQSWVSVPAGHARIKVKRADIVLKIKKMGVDLGLGLGARQPEVAASLIMPLRMRKYLNRDDKGRAGDLTPELKSLLAVSRRLEAETEALAGRNVSLRRWEADVTKLLLADPDAAEYWSTNKLKVALKLLAKSGHVSASTRIRQYWTSLRPK